MNPELLTFSADLGELEVEFALYKVLFQRNDGGVLLPYTEDGKFWFRNRSESVLSDVQVQLSFLHTFRGVVSGDRRPTWTFAQIEPGGTIAKDLSWHGNYFGLRLEAEYELEGNRRNKGYFLELDESDDHESHGQFNVVTELLDARSDDASEALIQVHRFLEPDLMAYFRADPRRLYEADPLVFEQLVGDLFASKGFDVSMTARTRDGGVDLVAIDANRDFPMKFVVQCKRYAAHRPISVDLVRELYGVLGIQGATKGVLATTSYFTRDALELGQQLIWHLDLKDYEDLVEWLKVENPLAGGSPEAGRY